jgi:hypothetical protein
MHRIRTLCYIVTLLAAPLCSARDLAVIVHKANPISTVTAAELEKVLKAGAPWPDGKKVKVFMTDPESADRKAILQRVYKMSPAEIKAFVEAHKAAIQLVASDEIVLTMVDNNPGAVGIVNVYSINSQVKVLKVDDKLPMEQGYLLHGN